MCVCPTPFLYFSFPPECVCVCVQVEPWPRERKKRLLCLCVCEGLKLLTQREYNDHCHIYNKSLCCLCWPLPWQNGGQSGGYVVICCVSSGIELHWEIGFDAHTILFFYRRESSREKGRLPAMLLPCYMGESAFVCVCVCVCRNKLPLFLHPDKKGRKKKIV
jgi:hypothetical protein